ncbi:ComEC/Rec2 family competence protein [Palleronia sp. LCG004]|uniref:ComEC/Rec2 family competence protein n=1 Tax=Palleronia sp. LCG004 TaxID=3079304 RepID=UPI002943612D|nr:ComEC/Rec2 family competence protein [Palleronia sp. LCG004]WOI55037.1 ComEC/Rec2 family competence protein [Palleronia sp. LCG004]
MATGTFARLSGALALDAQRGDLVLWVPVCLGIGIGLYFALPVEPSRTAWIALGSALAAAFIALGLGAWRWPIFAGLFLVMAGLALAGIRNHQVAGPVLDWRYYGAVEGRVIEIDRSASDMPRLTLDRVVLERVSADRTPHRVRISLHGAQDWLDPHPGQRIMVTAHLSQPQGPVEPGGFDFQRMAWFEGLGAVGYARTPALLVAEGGSARPIGRLRTAISAYVLSILPGEAGAFAAAITTGDRSAMGAGTLEALRASNLAHLLAISGLHMGLLTGVAFAALRMALVLVPGLALTRPVKKYAALGALAAGAFYLALSGGNVATQRAFIMAAVMLIAICLDRRAVTLRAVAVSATIVLLLRPEAVTEPGFQMSFAATTALVAVFRLFRDRGPVRRSRWLAPIVGVLMSSAIAGAATAPYGAAHFNQVSHYGLLANMLAVPLMGAVVMPAALLAACLAPLGLAWIGLWIMKPAVDWIMFVAHRVADLPHSVSHVPSAPPAFLPVFTLGMLFLILWRGRGRWAGAGVAAIAATIWVLADRPDILIAPSGGLVGVLREEGRALTKARGDGFAARVWLENDGNTPDQESAAARMNVDGGTAIVDHGGLELVQVMGRGASERAVEFCRRADIVVTTTDADLAGGPCLMLNAPTLRRTGALSIRVDRNAARLTSARIVSGRRPWNGGASWPESLPDLPIGARFSLAADQ